VPVVNGCPSRVRRM